MSYSNVPPPAALSGRPISARQQIESRREQEEKVQEYNKLTKGYQDATKSGYEDDETYFNTSDDERETLARKTSREDVSNQNEEEEEDELDAFMAGIEAQAKKDVATSRKKEQSAVTSGETSGGRSGRTDIEREDTEQSYSEFLEDYKQRYHEEAEDNYAYDEDGNIIWSFKKHIDPLPPIDHSAIRYPPFARTSYKEHPDIEKLTPREVFDVRNSLEIRVFGNNPPKPCVSFAHFGVNQKIINRLQRSEFEKPTPIQAQGIPAALAGRDVLGIAATGSGKTLVYVLSAIEHILAQPNNANSDSYGPVALVVVPTRELALQVYEQTRYYASPLGLSVVCAFGGGNKYEQTKALQEGCDICVCTPGRIIDLIKDEATDFLRTSFLVFDEADRMFDMGFEQQVKSISDHIRPDRQTLMFSATFPPKIEKLASHALNNPVKVLCGEAGAAESIEQFVHILPNQDAKFNWLFQHIVEFCSVGKLLIFVTKKTDSEIVAEKLRQRSFDLVLMHGDFFQAERNERLNLFKKNVPIMVATDVAARGLDINEIRTVVNFDAARDIDTHVHRIGRTGRAGQKGIAHTLLTEADKEFAGPLMQLMENAGQEIPTPLADLAKQSKWYAENATKTSGFSGGRSHFGLGYTERPKHPKSSLADPAALLAKPSVPKPQTMNVTKVVERAKSVASSSTGLGMSRYDTMRQVLKSSFKGAFTKATTSDDQSETTNQVDPTPSPAIKRHQPNEQQSQKKRSRWQ